MYEAVEPRGPPAAPGGHGGCLQQPHGSPTAAPAVSHSDDNNLQVCARKGFVARKTENIIGGANTIELYALLINNWVDLAIFCIVFCGSSLSKSCSILLYSAALNGQHICHVDPGCGPECCLLQTVCIVHFIFVCIYLNPSGYSGSSTTISQEMHQAFENVIIGSY